MSTLHLDSDTPYPDPITDGPTPGPTREACTLDRFMRAGTQNVCELIPTPMFHGTFPVVFDVVHMASNEGDDGKPHEFLGFLQVVGEATINGQTELVEAWTGGWRGLPPGYRVLRKLPDVSAIEALQAVAAALPESKLAQAAVENLIEHERVKPWHEMAWRWFNEPVTMAFPRWGMAVMVLIMFTLFAAAMRGPQ